MVLGCKYNQGDDCMDDRMQLEVEYFLELCDVMGEEVPVYLCGHPSSLSEVAVAQVRERGIYTYMADVERNEKGELLKVSYDRIEVV